MSISKDYVVVFDGLSPLSSSYYTSIIKCNFEKGYFDGFPDEKKLFGENDCFWY